ncbi:hypothetical protein VULLAG_LOCUS5360 [Vulpes lagopus]
MICYIISVLYTWYFLIQLPIGHAPLDFLLPQFGDTCVQEVSLGLPRFSPREAGPQAAPSVRQQHCARPRAQGAGGGTMQQEHSLQRRPLPLVPCGGHAGLPKCQVRALTASLPPACPWPLG